MDKASPLPIASNSLMVTLPSAPTIHLPRISFTPRTPVSDDVHDTPSMCTESSRIEKPSVTITNSKPRGLPSLPAELHLEIIDIIARRVPRTPSRDGSYDLTDLRTLCTCALVCKLWLSTARVGIWGGVRLRDRKESMTFVRLLDTYVSEPDGAALMWTIPSFGRYVSHLSVRETRGNAWDPKWLNDALPRLGAYLPRVQSLEMECVTWEYLSSRSRTACLESFRRAKSLALREFVFHTTSDMYDFLGEFGGLEVLTLDGVHCARRNTSRWLFDPGAEDAIKLPPTRLKEIGLRGVPMEHVLEWIMAGYNHERGLGRTRPGIESVRLGGVGVSEASTVGRFLKGVGDSVRKVHVGFDTDFVERGDLVVREIELAENTSLEEFHIFGLVVPSPPPMDPFEQAPPERALVAVTSLLSQIRSRMRVLSLAMYPADLRAMCAVDFDGLANVFDEWSCLDEVRIVVSNKEESRLGNAVRAHLGRLDARGVLKVNVGFDEREVL